MHIVAWIYQKNYENSKERNRTCKKIYGRLFTEVRIMSRLSVPFEEIEAKMLEDEEFRVEYERLRPRYEAIEQIIKARKDQNITQAELAKRVGTQKSNISRLESGNYNPSLDFLIRVAESLGKKLSIHLNA